MNRLETTPMGLDRLPPVEPLTLEDFTSDLKALACLNPESALAGLNHYTPE